MTKDDIVTVPEPNLRRRSKRVGIITDEIKQLITDMKAAALDWEQSREHESAVGLAAVQVNELYRIFIVRNDTENEADQQFTTFINPEIVKKTGPLEEDFEGCLSVPEIYGKVPRYQCVKVKAINENGEPFRVTAYGFLARLLQHETDHTNGKLFIDCIKDSKEAFYKMADDGAITPLDFNTLIKNNSILWDVDPHDD